MYGFPGPSRNDDFSLGTRSRNAIWGSTPSCHVVLSRSSGSGNSWQVAQRARASFSPSDLRGPQPAIETHATARVTASTCVRIVVAGLAIAYGVAELLTNARRAPSGDHEGTLIVPWPPYT